jgi:hypothetical protein
VASRWLDTLKEESKHTTALREVQSRQWIGPLAKSKVPVNLPSKTSKTTKGHQVEDKNLQSPEKPTVKTSKTPEPAQLGLVATWSGEFGYVSLHDRPPAGGTTSRRPLRQSGLWVRRDGVRNSTGVATGGRIGCRRVIWRRSGRATSPPRRASSRTTRSRVRSARRGPRA